MALKMYEVSTTYADKLVFFYSDKSNYWFNVRLNSECSKDTVATYSKHIPQSEIDESANKGHIELGKLLLRHHPPVFCHVFYDKGYKGLWYCDTKLPNGRLDWTSTVRANAMSALDPRWKVYGTGRGRGNAGDMLVAGELTEPEITLLKVGVFPKSLQQTGVSGYRFGPGKIKEPYHNYSLDAEQEVFTCGTIKWIPDSPNTEALKSDSNRSKEAPGKKTQTDSKDTVKPSVKGTPSAAVARLPKIQAAMDYFNDSLTADVPLNSSDSRSKATPNKERQADNKDTAKPSAGQTPSGIDAVVSALKAAGPSKQSEEENAVGGGSTILKRGSSKVSQKGHKTESDYVKVRYSTGRDKMRATQPKTVDDDDMSDWEILEMPIPSKG